MREKLNKIHKFLNTEIARILRISEEKRKHGKSVENISEDDSKRWESTTKQNMTEVYFARCWKLVYPKFENKKSTKMGEIKKLIFKMWLFTFHSLSFQSNVFITA